MFIEEEDWSDDQEAQVPSKAVIRNIQKESSSTNVKPKTVGKKSLLRTLQTLGSVPEWKSDEHPQDSDSETEATPSPGKKKKKKRRKRRKQAEKTETGEQQENGELQETAEGETAVTKKKKKSNKLGIQMVKNAAETKDGEKGKPVEEDNTKKLSRQQWKNKMKNKRKCKNKYGQKKPEEGVNNGESGENDEAKEEVKTDLNSDNKSKGKKSETPVKKKEKERKAQKRKKISCVTEAQTLTAEEGETVKKGATESKQTAGEAEVTIADDTQSPTKRLKPELSKDQSLKREKLRKLLHNHKTDLQAEPDEKLTQEPEEQPEEQPEDQPGPEEKPSLDRSASLRSRMEQRLESARFRYINEVLYSTTSGEARRMFKQDPQAFGIYHRGYTAQVQRWPANPVDAIISYIQQKPASLVVADFGCGDCKIARSVKNKVHSFDLAAACELVTVCDMANVPLGDASVDIVVFCLSLMGTNLADFLSEANRVLKMGGVLKIAEVASRFENVRSFTTGLANLGFKMVTKDTENSHFFSFDLVKTAEAPENVKKFGLELKPCVYKKR